MIRKQIFKWYGNDNDKKSSSTGAGSGGYISTPAAPLLSWFLRIILMANNEITDMPTLVFDVGPSMFSAAHSSPISDTVPGLRLHES